MYIRDPAAVSLFEKRTVQTNKNRVSAHSLKENGLTKSYQTVRAVFMLSHMKGLDAVIFQILWIL